MITLQTISETPNAVYVPQIIIQTGIMNGQPLTSCQIVLAGVKIDNPHLLSVDSGLRTPDFTVQAEAAFEQKQVDPVGKDAPIIPMLNNWTPTGQTQTIYISDLANLEPDMEELGAQIVQFYTILMDIVEVINATRKVI